MTARAACPVCGGQASSELYSRPYSSAPISDFLTAFYGRQGRADLDVLRGTSFVLKQCQECDLIYQSAIPDETLTHTLYEEWIDPVRARPLDLAEEDPLGDAVEIANLISYLRESRSGRTLRVLDFGSGWATWTYLAKLFGCEVFGSEISEARIDYTRRLGLPVLSWSEIGRERFDLINAEQVFEHLANPTAVLAYLASALAPNGVLKIGVPDGRSVIRNLGREDWLAEKTSAFSLNAVSPLEHLNCFVGRSLLTMATLCGLARVNPPPGVAVVGYSSPLRLGRDLMRPAYRRLWPLSYRAVLRLV